MKSICLPHLSPCGVVSTPWLLATLRGTVADSTISFSAFHISYEWNYVGVSHNIIRAHNAGILVFVLSDMFNQGIPNPRVAGSKKHCNNGTASCVEILRQTAILSRYTGEVQND